MNLSELNRPDDKPAGPPPSALSRKRDIGNPADWVKDVPEAPAGPSESAFSTNLERLQRKEPVAPILPPLPGLPGSRRAPAQARKGADAIAPGTASVKLPKMVLEPARLIKSKLIPRGPAAPPAPGASLDAREPRSPGARRPPGLDRSKISFPLGERPPQSPLQRQAAAILAAEASTEKELPARALPLSLAKPAIPRPELPKPPAAAQGVPAREIPRPELPRPDLPKKTIAETVLAKAALREERPIPKPPSATARPGTPAARPESTPRQARPHTPTARQFDASLLAVVSQVRQGLRDGIPRFGHHVRRLAPGRRLLACALAVLLVVLAVPHTPLMSWTHSALASAGDNIKARAAFRFADDFAMGPSEHWETHDLVLAEPGVAGLKGLALHRGSMTREGDGWRMDFDTKLDSKGIGWVVRAVDARNYYAFQLQASTDRKQKHCRLTRYPVINGEAQMSEKVEVEVPPTSEADGFQRVSVRLRETRIATFVNGSGVDYFDDNRLTRGGVGFFADHENSGLIRKVVVSGNEDSWGLFLYGFLELIQGARDFAASFGAQSGPPSPSAVSS